ncbi:hypothetical protein DPEC_G00308750 [Dallia pectoralis]|uniref:Uncharacterized protein n=1 Tax=Dallia pectoralis TaxID=75939 RepID=A0ACC2FES1_DALPE|nr:hypothetical protein DPEC_G00308750 [Dallia pectoralis]
MPPSASFPERLCRTEWLFFQRGVFSEPCNVLNVRVSYTGSGSRVMGAQGDQGSDLFIWTNAVNPDLRAGAWATVATLEACPTPTIVCGFDGCSRAYKDASETP